MLLIKFYFAAPPERRLIIRSMAYHDEVTAFTYGERLTFQCVNGYSSKNPNNTILQIKPEGKLKLSVSHHKYLWLIGR